MDNLTLKNELNEVSTTTQLEEWLDTLCIALNALYFDFTLYFPESMQKNRKFQMSNYAPEWQKELDSAQLQLANPFVEHCQSSTIPMIWSSLECSSKYKGAKYRNFVEKAKQFDLYDGLSATTRGYGSKFGILHINGLQQASQSDHEQLIASVQSILPYLFEKSLHLSQMTATEPVLTAREKECVAWACDGKTSWEISKILGLSERTVIFHMTNCMRKTQTTNRQQAIAKSILNGYVSPAI